MARVTVDPQAVRDDSRLVALQMAVALLRQIEAYQEMFGPDLDRLMIILAVGAITAERPVKAQDSPEHYVRFGVPIPSEHMARCTALAIAAATGLPRETARRKTRQLIDDGLLRRDDKVGIRVNERSCSGPNSPPWCCARPARSRAWPTCCWSGVSSSKAEPEQITRNG